MLVLFMPETLSFYFFLLLSSNAQCSLPSSFLLIPCATEFSACFYHFFKGRNPKLLPKLFCDFMFYCWFCLFSPPTSLLFIHLLKHLFMRKMFSDFCASRPTGSKNVSSKRGVFRNFKKGSQLCIREPIS